MPCVFCNKESVTEVGIGFQSAHAETLSFCKSCFSQAQEYFDGELATPTNQKIKQYVETEAFYVYWEYKETIARNRKWEHIKHQQAMFHKTILQQSKPLTQDEESEDEEENDVDKIQVIHNSEEDENGEYSSYSESEELKEKDKKRKRSNSNSPPTTKDFLDEDVSEDERSAKKVKPPLLLNKKVPKTQGAVITKEKPKNPDEVVVLEDEEEENAEHQI